MIQRDAERERKRGRETPYMVSEKGAWPKGERVCVCVRERERE